MRYDRDEPPAAGPRREQRRIARIAAILGNSVRPEITLGIGDDAAILDPRALRAGEQLVWTIDASVQDVHFRPELLSWEDVGFRATVAAVSDLFAMGARPVAALVGWTLPPNVEEETIDAIALGQRQAAGELGISIVGGNISTAEVLSLSTTALGATTRPVGRRGARPGDRLVLVGALGEAALGLSWLMRGLPERLAARMIEAWRRPRVLAEAGLSLGAVANAMIDISDGLATDVGHLAEASGVHVRIDLTALAALRSEDAIAAAEMIRAPLDDLELAGGEDYALVAALPPGTPVPEGAHVIGAFEEGSGVMVVDGEGKPRGHVPDGWSHGG